VNYSIQASAQQYTAQDGAVLALLVAVSLWDWQRSFADPPPCLGPPTVNGTPPVAPAPPEFGPSGAWYFSSLLVVAAIAAKMCSVQEESVLVIAELGVQLCSKRQLGSTRFRFIDMADIEGVVLHEGIQRQRTQYFMAFVVRGQRQLTLGFTHLLPPLPELLHVYHGTRLMLEGEKRVGGDASGKQRAPRQSALRWEEP